MTEIFRASIDGNEDDIGARDATRNVGRDCEVFAKSSFQNVFDEKLKNKDSNYNEINNNNV